MESTAFNLKTWSMQYIPMSDGYMISTHDRWNPWQILMRDGVQSFCSKYLPMRVGDDNIFSSEVEYTAFFNDWCSPKHWLSRDGVHNFYWVEMGSTACTDLRWSKYYFLMSDKVHRIFSRLMLSKTLNLKKWGPQFYWLEMEYTLLIYEMWRPQHWLSRHGFKSICS